MAVEKIFHRNAPSLRLDVGDEFHRVVEVQIAHLAEDAGIEGLPSAEKVVARIRGQLNPRRGGGVNAVTLGVIERFGALHLGLLFEVVERSRFRRRVVSRDLFVPLKSGVDDGMFERLGRMSGAFLKRSNEAGL